MKKTINAFIIFIMFSALLLAGNRQFEKDIIKTNSSELTITFIGHASLMFTFNGKIIHVDPFSQMADYSLLPPADLILITHHHGDHLDPEAIKLIRQEKTKITGTQKCAPKIDGCIVMNNGDVKTVAGFKIEAVSAYNIIHKRDNGEPYHIKGEGNGYMITFGDKRVYVAGDTEIIPEMKELKNIDVAFLPMNLPYTMTPQMVAEAAKTFKPHILYPYHDSGSDTAHLVELLKNEKDMDVRIRNMYPPSSGEK